MYYTDSSARLLDDIKCMAKLKAEHSKKFSFGRKYGVIAI